MNVFSKVFGTRSQREVKRIMPLVEKTESYQSQMQQLTDEQLRDKTREYKKRLAEGATLDDLLPEAFATVREAAKRVLGMEHYRVQIIGGIILHQGRIAEMKTGEGKHRRCTDYQKCEKNDLSGGTLLSCGCTVPCCTQVS